MTPDEFAARCQKASKSFTGKYIGINAAAELVARTATGSLAGATHGTMRLRGVKSAKPMGVKLQKAQDTDKPKAIVAGKPGGQWSWLESGTDKHLIGTGRGAVGALVQGRTARVTKRSKAGKYSTRTSKRPLIKIGSRVVYGPFMAGGSPAKHTFSKAVNAAEPQVARIMSKATMGSAVKALNGR